MKRDPLTTQLSAIFSTLHCCTAIIKEILYRERQLKKCSNKKSNDLIIKLALVQHICYLRDSAFKQCVAFEAKTKYVNIIALSAIFLCTHTSFIKIQINEDECFYILEVDRFVQVCLINEDREPKNDRNATKNRHKLFKSQSTRCSPLRTRIRSVSRRVCVYKVIVVASNSFFFSITFLSGHS